MGLIAHDFFNELIEETTGLLKEKKEKTNKISKKRIAKLQTKINLIGNDIIRRRLQAMLDLMNEDYYIDDTNDFCLKKR